MGRMKRILKRAKKAVKLYCEGSAKVSVQTPTHKKRLRMYVLADMFFCHIRYGAPPDDYYAFDFYGKSAKQRSTYFTKRMYKKVLIRNNRAEYNIITTDKYICAKVYADFFRRRSVAKNSLLTETDFVAFVSAVRKFVYKPLSSSKGSGIEVFEVVDNSEIKQLYDKLSAYPDGVLEEWIKQHPQIAEIYPDAVNCLRITTVLDKGNCVFLDSVFSVGRSTKIANLASGALSASVDVTSGELTSLLFSADFEESFRFHPQTGFDIQGFQIPFWRDILGCVGQASKIVPQLGYVAWDIALSESGPVIIEANRGGYYFYQQLLGKRGEQGEKSIRKKYI